MLRLKHFRDTAQGLPDLLNWAAVIDDGIVLNKDGSLLAGWFYRGSDVASATADELNALGARVNAALARLGTGWVLHQDAIRVPSRAYPATGAFPDPVTRLIEEERRRQFHAEGAHYESVHTLIVTYFPPFERQSRLTEMMFEEDGKAARGRIADRVLEQFRFALDELEDQLSGALVLRRLRGRPYEDEHGRAHVADLLLQYLHYAVSGQNHPVNLPPCPMYLDAVIGGHELWGGVTPRLDDRYLAAVAIDGFPQASFPGILAALDQLPVEYRWSRRFIFLDPHEAQALLKKYRRQWQQKVRGFVDQVFKTGRGVVDQDALDMVGETESALAQAAGRLVAFGYYTSVVILMDPDRGRLDENARALRKAIQDLGFSARVETLNTLEAWLGSLPGHVAPNVRRPLLHTLNLSDLLPLAAIWPGREYNPCPYYPPKSPPLLHAGTDGATPFRLNLHVGDLGHTLVFGPTGSGKSTLLALIAAQFRRYPEATVFVFDKGRSMLPLCLAAGGTHYDIGADRELHFCPLGGIASDAEQAWAEEWIAALVELQGVKVLPSHKNEIHRAMGLLRSSQVHSVLELVFNLQDPVLREALKHFTVEGAMGRLLDAERDGLRSAPFQVFEVEELMALGDKNLIPVLLYLFHRIEQRLRGQPALLVLDEAWVMLGHPVFREKIREWLKVMRKANCAVVLATQSLSDASRSGLLDVLTESCPTKILLPNYAAREDGARPFYEQMGLNARQIEIIASATPKRHYYYLSPEGRRLFDLNLGPVALAFCGASSKEEERLHAANEN
jgi:type IV secretion system protein VirB4